MAVNIDFTNLEGQPWFAESVIEAANEFLPGLNAQDYIEAAKDVAKSVKPDGPFEFPHGVQELAAAYRGPGGDSVPPQTRDTRVTQATPAFTHFFEKNKKVFKILYI